MTKHGSFGKKPPKALIIILPLIAVIIIAGVALHSAPGGKTFLNLITGADRSDSNKIKEAKNSSSTESSSASKEPSLNTSFNVGNIKQGLQIYLATESSSKTADDNKNLDKLELEEQPLFSGTDIISYNWDMHCLKINNNGKISRKLLQRRFVVVSDGERIYSGAFWSAIYSAMQPRIAVYLDEFDETAPTVIIPLAGWRPEVKPEKEALKILEDARVKNVLEREGKLFKPYEPNNFKRPDYMEIYDKSSSCNYAGFDWDKKDSLLKLLDARISAGFAFEKHEPAENDTASIYQNSTIITLGYNETQDIRFGTNGNESIITAKELIMPVTGNYDSLLFFKDGNGNISDTALKLEKLPAKDISLIKAEIPVQKRTEAIEPDGMNLSYYKGRPFELITHTYYELSREEAKTAKNAAASVKLLKSLPAGKPAAMPLTLKFGKNDSRWFNVLDDEKTLFSNGRYYSSPELAKLILKLAREKCGVSLFKQEDFKGISSAKYSFRTRTQTIERVVGDKSILAGIEKGLQAARYDMGGGCPFSDGVLTLSMESGKTIEISMASDDCTLLFLNGSYMSYSGKLHKLLSQAFDNFPYVSR